MDTCNLELINQIRSSVQNSPDSESEIVSNTIVEVESNSIQLYYMQRLLAPASKMYSIVSLKYELMGQVEAEKKVWLDADLYIKSGVLHKEYLYPETAGASNQ